MCNYEVMWFTKCWEYNKQLILEHQLFSPTASTKPIVNKNTQLKAPFCALFFKCYIFISCFLFIEKYHILCIFLHIIEMHIKKNVWLSQFSGILKTAVIATTLIASTIQSNCWTRNRTAAEEGLMPCMSCLTFSISIPTRFSSSISLRYKQTPHIGGVPALNGTERSSYATPLSNDKRSTVPEIHTFPAYAFISPSNPRA